MGALSAMARADGASSIHETLAVLEELDLDGLTDEAVAVACAAVLDPPPFDSSLEALREQSSGMLTEIMARLLLVARCDGDLQAAENQALRRARELLALGDRQMSRATKRFERERWRRAHALERAHDIDSWRNLLVAAAGFVVPIAVIFRLGLARTEDPVRAIVLGVLELGQGFGLVPGIVVAMAISAAAAAATSLVTLRGWRAERLRNEVSARSERLRVNLRTLVEHASHQLAKIRHANGPRVAYKTLEGRVQTFQTALLRLKSED